MTWAPLDLTLFKSINVVSPSFAFATSSQLGSAAATLKLVAKSANAEKSPLIKVPLYSSQIHRPKAAVDPHDFKAVPLGVHRGAFGIHSLKVRVSQWLKTTQEKLPVHS